MDPEAFHVKHTWSMEGIRTGVERLLAEDDELLLRMVPLEVREEERGTPTLALI